MLMHAQRGGRGIAPTHLQPSTRRRWVVSTALRPLYRRKDPVPIVQEAEWASGTVGMAQKFSPPPGFNTWTVQPVASHYTGYAVLANGDWSSFIL
jgi:hypothetical protein